MSLFQHSIAVYKSRLKMFDALLAKAQSHPDGDALMAERIAEDMHPLATQIRFVANIPGEALARLGVREYTSSDADLKTIEEGKALIAQTLAALSDVKHEELPADDAPMEFEIGGGAFAFAMSAEDYVREFSLPNFYFHLTTAYAILRMKGLEIGKADFIPHMMHYATRGPQ